MSTTLLSYNQEIVPLFTQLAESKALLKEKVDVDTVVQDFQAQIKEMQEAIKEHLEDKYSEIVREIKDLETDIKLAVKGAARGTNFKAAELKSFFQARAKQSVEKVVGRGELFSQLEKEIS